MATTNPFEITAPDPTKSMATNAATAASSPTPATNLYTSSALFIPATTSTYNPTSTFAEGFDASTYGASGYNAGNYKPEIYDSTNWNTNPSQMVQGQLTNIIASDSPLIQQAKTGALQQMNQRGLINSSMAIGAGQDAVIRNALPIAQQDATTNANSAQFNANAQTRQISSMPTQLTKLANLMQTLITQQFSLMPRLQIKLVNLIRPLKTKRINLMRLQQTRRLLRISRPLTKHRNLMPAL